MQKAPDRSGDRSGTFDPFAGGRLLDSAPTTESQREILAAMRLGPSAALAYNEVVHVRFDGRIDADALEHELRALYRRHPALRSTFSSDDEAFFVWDRELDVLRPDVSPEDQDAVLARVIETDTTEVMDVQEGPLFRATIVQAEPGRADLVLAAHHLVCDGWSYGVLIRELSEGYRAGSSGRVDRSVPSANDFASYARRDRQLESTRASAEAVEYWTGLFQGSVPVLDLPIDHPRPPARSFHAHRVDAMIDGELLSRLRAAAATCETSLFGLMLAAFYVVLGRLTRQNDLVVAVPAAGQSASGMADVVGHCVNVLPLRMVTDQNESLPALASRVTSRLSDAFAHQEFTLGRLMRSANIARDPARPAVASVMFNMDRVDRRDFAGFGDIDVAVRGVPRVAEYFEIFLNLFEEAEGVRLECQYAQDLFEEATIVEWLESYLTMLRGIAEDPSRPVDDLPWVPRRTLALLGCLGDDADAGAWQGPPRGLDAEESVLTLFQARAEETPHATAVRWQGGESSYESILQRSAGVSHGLAALGVSPGDRVGVYLDRDGNVPVCLLGIMGAGAAYVPLDLRDPAERLARTIEDAAPTALVTDERNLSEAKRLADPRSIPVVTLSSVEVSGHRAFARHVERPDDQVAYVIYTSGSTGVPKGVEVTHRNLANLLLGMADLLGAGPETAIPAITTLSFDISVLEVFLPLVVGGRTLPVGSEQTTDPLALARAMAELGATVVQATPSTWSMLVDSGWSGQSGITALVGGETLSTPLARALLTRVDRVWNVYGPTETTVWSACHRVTSGETSIPIGKPIANTVIHVLDAAGRPVPLGVPGELTIGGAGVARGYLKRPDLTADRFVPAPTACAGGRLYRTGDLGKWGTDGRLRFLRRLDEQVKVRGHRVELGEIESALESHPVVRVAAAALRAAGGRDEPQLVAWFEPRSDDGEPSSHRDVAAELRAHLKHLLPGYMVPEHLLAIDRMPMSSAGKVDKKALRFDAPSPRRPADPGSVPSDATARFVATTWAEVLGLDEVFLEDDFFELGGHSILGVRVVTRVDRHFGIGVGFRTLFEAPTLGAFTQRVRETCGERGRRVDEGGEAADLRLLGEDVDGLSLQQERLWYLHRIEDGLTAYNLSGAFSLDGALDVGSLESALRAFVDRHELLHAFVREDSGRPKLDTSGPTELSFRILDLGEIVGENGTEDDLKEWLEHEAERPLALDTAPLIGFTLVRVSETRHMLFLLVHHIFWDGRCFDVFLRDVGALYESRITAESPKLPALHARYQDFVGWQRGRVSGTRLEEAARFWDDVFATEPPTLDLPLQGSRPPEMTYAGDRVPVYFEADVLERLRHFARSEGSTVYLVLLSVFKVLLHRYTQQRDLIVATPVEGRAMPEFEDLIGFFVNTLVVRTRPSGALSFRDFHRQVRDTFLDAVEFQDTPFDWLVHRYARRDMSRTPLFQAMFTHQQTTHRRTAWGEVGVRSFPRGTRSATTDLGLWVREYDGYIDGGLDYRVDLFDRATMEDMADALHRLVGSVLDDPDVSLGNAKLLSREREGAETVGRSGPADPEMPQKPYLAQVRNRADRGPGEPAVRGADGAWLGRSDLWDSAGRVASVLLQSGVEPGDVVGLMVERSEHLAALVLGIHRAGCVYLPLDPEFPDARLRHMVRDSGAGFVLADAGSMSGRSTLLEESNAGLIPTARVLDRGLEVSRLEQREPRADDVAYLMYTSGSTGVPKAVEVTHASLANLLASAAETIGVGEADSIVALTTISFDISLLELLLPLCAGARLIVADDDTVRDPLALAELIRESGATIVQATPATWIMLLEAGWRGRLRKALSGGEALSRQLADRLLERADHVWNLYGPTETTVWSTAAEVLPHDEGVPIGRPLHNTRIYVLDADLHPVPTGTAAEIWIAGAGLARGYRDRPELTSQRFLSDPFVTGEKMYQTGDLGRWREDGRLEHLGRLDLQVKVNGFRIELGEIETALERLDEVRQAIVEARGTEADRRLIAFVKFETGKSLLAGEIRRSLKDSLPSFMIPALVVEVDEFPLTPNGKIDRTGLADPISQGSPVRQYQEPEPGLEETVADVWRELLAVPRVGRHDNFFELGGHSLLSIQATVEIERRSGHSLDPRDFFFRSLAELAATVRA